MKESRKQKCGAKTRAGTPCRRWALNGSNRCRLHGGKTQSGSASANYKHGKYSQALPAGDLSGYKHAWQNPRILELTDEIALVDLHICNILASSKDRPRSGGVHDILRSIDAIMHDLQGDDVEISDAISAIASIGEMLRAAIDETEAWQEIGDFIERRRKLVDTERRQAELLSEFVHKLQLAEYLRRIMDVSKDVITDRGQLDRLLDGFMTISFSDETNSEN